jgi:hypothetical protein
VDLTGQKLDDRLASLGIEARGRLVRQQDRGIVDERPGDGHPLLFATRQLSRQLPGPSSEAERFEQVLEALVAAQVSQYLSDLERSLDGVQDAGERLRLAAAMLVRWTGGQAARRPARARHGGPPSRAVVGRIHRPLAELHDRLVVLVAAARDAGALPADTEPVLATRFVVAVVRGTRAELGRSGHPEIARRLHEFILGGLGLHEDRA